MSYLMLVSVSASTSGLSNEMEIENRSKLEGCMASEATMIVLDLIELLSSDFQVCMNDMDITLV